MLVSESTAQIKAIFSHWSYVHSSISNRLGNKKSSELLDMYYFLKYSNSFVSNTSRKLKNPKKKHLNLQNKDFLDLEFEDFEGSEEFDDSEGREELEENENYEVDEDLEGNQYILEMFE